MNKFDEVSRLFLIYESEDPRIIKIRDLYNRAQQALQSAVKQHGPFSQHHPDVMTAAKRLRILRNALWKQHSPAPTMA